MKYIVAAVSNKTGNIIDIGDETHNLLGEAIREFDRLEECIDEINVGFRWAVFSLNEIAVDETFSKTVTPVIYDVKDQVSINGVVGTIVDITVTPKQTAYGVKFLNGDYVIVEADKIEGKI